MLDAFFGAPYDAMDDCPEPDDAHPGPAPPPAILAPGLPAPSPQGTPPRVLKVTDQDSVKARARAPSEVRRRAATLFTAS